MSEIREHTQHFTKVTQKALSSMFGTSVSISKEAEERKSLDTDKQFVVSIFYTGTVFGEYVLAMETKRIQAMVPRSGAPV